MEYYLGQIELFAINFQPSGWIPCDGRLMDVRYNQALFALLGNRFGGDGINNFAVPDLRTSMFASQYDVKIRYYICTNGIWPQRDM